MPLDRLAPSLSSERRRARSGVRGADSAAIARPDRGARSASGLLRAPSSGSPGQRSGDCSLPATGAFARATSSSRRLAACSRSARYLAASYWRSAGAQCRLHGADQRHGLNRPLLQRHVPQIGDQPQRMLPAPWIVMTGRQDDEREVGPWRLLLHPVEQPARSAPKNASSAITAAPAPLPARAAIRRCRSRLCTASPACSISRTGGAAVAAGRREHQDALAVLRDRCRFSGLNPAVFRSEAAGSRRRGNPVRR